MVSSVACLPYCTVADQVGGAAVQVIPLMEADPYEPWVTAFSNKYK